MSAAPDVDPWLMGPTAYGTGGVTTRTAGGHTDVFLDNPTNYTRIGVRMDWGASVVFFGLVASESSNVIDANDTGRELQIALYDPERQMQGCAYNASCVTNPTSCTTSITFLGWNPVQGGDECGHGSQASWSVLADGLQVTVHPVQWNPDWDQPDCRTSSCPASAVPVDVTYVMEFRFLTQHVVQVKLEVVSTETIDHAPTGQEFPTLYVSHGTGGPDLSQLLDASGTLIDVNQPANDGFFVRDFDSTAPWVTFQNASRDYGVGLAMDQGVTGFQGWRGEAVYFHNVRPRLSFGLRAGRAVRGISYLALGAEGTVAQELNSVLANRAPFGVVEMPVAGMVTHVPAGQVLNVGGWVLDGDAVSRVELLLDGQVVETLARNQARPDVCEVYPNYLGCPTAGYAGSVDLGGAGACHLLAVRAVDERGNVQILGERVVVRDP